MTPPSPPSSSARFVDSKASVLFDLLRGIAALLVFVGHGRNLFFVDYPNVTSHRTLLLVPYVLTSGGHQAVIVFFVLSGFFISGAVFRAVERDQWQWVDYLTRRLVRLWVVLVPALLLCLLWDKLGIHLGHAPALYTGNVDNHMLPDVTRMLSPAIFFGNLFFLQSILVPVLGSDGALWSLANEFWYYMLFPLGFFALRSATRVRARLICGLLFAAIAWFVGGDILALFPAWLTGTLLLVFPRPSFSAPVAHRLRLLSAAIYLFVFFAVAKTHLVSGLISDYVLTVFTFVFLWILLSATQRAESTPAVRVSRELARFSYTLYAVHIPLLTFLVSIILGESRWTPTPLHLLYGIGIALLLAYAYGLASATEFRTDALRQWLERRLHLAAPPSALPSNPHAIPAKNTPK